MPVPIALHAVRSIRLSWLQIAHAVMSLGILGALPTGYRCKGLVHLDLSIQIFCLILSLPFRDMTSTSVFLLDFSFL